MATQPTPAPRAAVASLRSMLRRMVWILALPLVGATAVFALGTLNAVVDGAGIELQAAARTLAAQADMRVLAARGTLERLAERPLIRRLDPERCDPALAELHSLSPGYTNIAVTDLRGRALCMARAAPGAAPVEVGGFAWFQAFLRSGGFHVGEAHTGPVSGRRVVVLSAPLRDDARRLVGGLHLPLELAALAELPAATRLADQATWGLLDARGQILWAGADVGQQGGNAAASAAAVASTATGVAAQLATSQAARSVIDSAAPDASAGRSPAGPPRRPDAWTVTTSGADGVERLIAVARAEHAGWVAYAAVPKWAIQALALRRSIGAAGIAALAVLATLMLAMPFARRIEVAVRDLAQAAQRVGRGDTHARANPQGPRELQEVAREFNAMLDARRRLEAQLEAFTDTHDVLAWLKDGEGRYVYANRGLQSLAARRGCTLIGRTDREVWDLDLAEAYERNDAAVAARGSRIDVVEQRDGRRGARRWWLSHKFAFDDADGNRLVGGLAVDIDQRKRLVDRLSLSEQRYRDLSELSADWHWETDAEHRLTFISKGFAKSLRSFDREEALGKPRWELPGVWPTAPVWEQMRGLMTRREPFQALEFDRRADDGRSYTTSVSGRPQFDGAGRFTGYRGVGSDVTERRCWEREMRLAAVAFDTQEGITVTDERRVILKVNRAFTRITGYSAAEAVGQTPRLLKSGRHDRVFYDAMNAALERDGFWSGEIWNRRKSGEVYPEWLSISVVHDGEGRVTNYVATFSDITWKREAERTIEQLVFYDPLTALANRRLLTDRLEQERRSSRRSRQHGALFYMDLDHFKSLNDGMGHAAGDQLLVQFAGRLKDSVRGVDTVARPGGDEFVVLLSGLDAEAARAALEARAVVGKIRESLQQPFLIDDQTLRFTISIGVCLFLGEEVDADELLRRADIAMYQAKRAGRNGVCFFDPATQRSLEERVLLEADLHAAVAGSQLLLHYQPQFDAEGAMYGAEALVRWMHPQRGLVPPGEFIPLAEDTGLILDIGDWVLETACAQLAAWRGDAAACHLSVSVNVSARQFAQADLVDRVMRVVERTGAPAHRLVLELTESLVPDDLADAVVKMRALRARGLRLSIDDFGTGHSSLAHLARLPIDELKIDRSFVQHAMGGGASASIVQTIIGMASNLGLHVVAEGVETAEQRAFLARHGCPAYQGFHFGRPVPVAEFGAALRARAEA